MTALAVLAATGLVSWVARVLFIGVLPARRLPARVREILDFVGPAVLAGLVATSLARDGGLPALVTPSPALLALVVSGVVVWRTRHLALGVAAALATFWLVGSILT